MKSKSYTVFFVGLFFTFLWAACNPTVEKLKQKVKTAEDALFANDDKEFHFDAKRTYAAIEAYQEFAEAFPNDTATPEFLFRKADLYRSLKEGDKSVQTYNHILSHYPNFHKAPYCLFLKGFVLENEIGNFPKAKEAYEAFLNQHPNHVLAKDVKFSLSNLGKSPEEIIQQFELENEVEQSEP